jgi:hypothetical protein
MTPSLIIIFLWKIELYEFLYFHFTKSVKTALSLVAVLASSLVVKAAYFINKIRFRIIRCILRIFKVLELFLYII